MYFQPGDLVTWHRNTKRKDHIRATVVNNYEAQATDATQHKMNNGFVAVWIKWYNAFGDSKFSYVPISRLTHDTISQKIREGIITVD